MRCIGILTYSLQGDSSLHQIEDGKTASASKLELAAISTFVRDRCPLPLTLLKKRYRPEKPRDPWWRTTSPTYRGCSPTFDPYGMVFERCTRQKIVQDRARSMLPGAIQPRTHTHEFATSLRIATLLASRSRGLFLCSRSNGAPTQRTIMPC